MARRKRKPSLPVAIFGGLVFLIIVIGGTPKSINGLLAVVIGAALLAVLGFTLFKLATRNSNKTKPRSNPKSPPLPKTANPIIAPERPEQWSHEAITLLEWKRFEDLCANYFIAKGHNAKVTGAGADGGIDVALYATQEPDKLISIVQCKAWTNRKVGVKDIREFFGVLTAEACPLGIFVSRSSYSDDAMAFAEGKPIKLIDTAKLLALIQSLAEEEQDALLKKTFAGDFHTPSCPNCETKLALRTVKKGKQQGHQFWGCGNYPKCRYTLQIAKS